MTGALTTVAVLAGDAGDDDHKAGWGGGWMWLWGTLMMLTWVAVIATAVWLVSRSMRGGRTGPGSRAQEILAERYARGELTTEEYQERRDQLDAATGGRP